MEWNVPEYEYVDNTIRHKNNRSSNSRSEEIQYDEDGNELPEEELQSILAEEKVLMELAPTVTKVPITERTKLKRELKAEALTRLEEAARTEEDFKAVIKEWDKQERNRERKERAHTISRGAVPLEFDMTYDYVVFPLWKCNPVVRQIQQGNFLDYLNDCPYEMHDLSSKDYIRSAVFRQKEEHKELLYFLKLQQYKAVKLAEIYGQTDRNIRKMRSTALRKVQKRLYSSLCELKLSGYSLSIRERRFMEKYAAGLINNTEPGEEIEEREEMPNEQAV